MRIEGLLKPDEIAHVAVRQSEQQLLWRSVPEQGYDLTVNDQSFLVLPGVFPPRHDSEFLLKNLSVPSGSTVLDVGTGSGILAVMACKNGAERGVALDINPAAVRNAQANVDRHGLQERIAVRLSDGLAMLTSNEVFDVIIANLPGRAADAKDHVEAAQWDTGFATHRAFFDKVGNHLSPNGQIIMTKANYPEINDVRNG